MNGKEIIFEALKMTQLDTVHITVDPERSVSATDSRFGGDFYLPQGKNPPACSKYGEMEFLGQINFSHTPHIQGFPQKGILQFFLCTEEAALEEMEDDYTFRSSDGLFQVVYYPEAENSEYCCSEHLPENRWLTKKLLGGMSFTKANETATLSIGEEGFLTDMGWEDALDVLSSELLQKAGYDLSDCPDTDRFCLEFGNWGCKFGGHPAIRQADFRLEEDECEEYSVLLFQMDLTSPDELEGDTFCFFIKPKDLQECRFDDVLLIWHNCF